VNGVPGTPGINAFGLPNDQDSFAELKDKRASTQYKAFDWSDPSKFESVRNVLGEGQQPPVPQGGGVPPQGNTAPDSVNSQLLFSDT
jgi:hypothetical protein